MRALLRYLLSTLLLVAAGVLAHVNGFGTGGIKSSKGVVAGRSLEATVTF